MTYLPGTNVYIPVSVYIPLFVYIPVSVYIPLFVYILLFVYGTDYCHMRDFTRIAISLRDTQISSEKYTALWRDLLELAFLKVFIFASSEWGIFYTYNRKKL